MAKLSKSPAEKPRDIKRVDIDEYKRLGEERRELNRQAAALEKREKALERDITAYVLEKAGKVRSLDRCGHRLSVEEVAGTVSWQSEFEKLRGQAEVERLKAAAPKRDKLRVVEL